MKKARLEAFSDGVLAIIMTIMVLELHAPRDASLAALAPLAPVFVSYLLSFVYIGIYWSNHHHMMHAVDEVSGAILLANNHLLFWLSLVPFTTAWMGENHFASGPVALYGVVLLMSGVAYFILSRALIAHHGKHSALAQAIGADAKGLWSVALYAVAVPIAFAAPWAAGLVYAGVALMWLWPDRRIERFLGVKRAPARGGSS